MSTPAQWSEDPHGRFARRYWDGFRWTDAVLDDQGNQLREDPSGGPPVLVRAAAPPPPLSPAISTTDPPPAAGVPGVAATSPSGRDQTSPAPVVEPAGLVAGARERAGQLHAAVASSEAAKKLGDATSAAGRRAVEAVSDPQVRAAFAAGLAPMIDAALEGARLKGRNGGISKPRVLRAAVRPRKTVMGALADVGTAAPGQVMASVASAGARAAKAQPSVWTTSEIAGEWALLDPAATEAALLQGLWLARPTENPDRATMLTAAATVCTAMSHCLTEEPRVSENVIIEGIAAGLNSTYLGNDWDSWTDADLRHLRLCLAVARRFGVQSEELGGNSELEHFFDEPHERMTMAMSVSRTGWSTDLSAWFALEN